jgi:uncharacterized repeat protein (TIGR01451 family)
MLRHMHKRMASALAVAALVLGAADVVKAAGTLAGTNINNTATVNYTVNTVAQPALNASAAFVVDRRIDLTLTPVLATYRDVTPGTTGNAIPFTLTNTSNAPLNFALAASNVADPFGGTDNFDPTVNNVFVDSNANGTYDAGVDTAVTVDTLAADGTTTVFIVSTIPGGQAGGSIAGVAMTATARETTANGGGAVTQDAGADVAATVQTVFADGAGPYDAARDAAMSDDGAFRVLGATVTVTKTETVISDPINGVTNPKHIPGAIVEYTVTVANAATANANADLITLTDVMPANVLFSPDTYAVGQGIRVGGVAKTNTNGDADGADFTGSTVTVTIATLAPNSSTVITFRVTVQ